ncbi:glycosyltransferase family 2 protein [Francisella sp. 19X1-34]|uniref:glycosyltransferase family 2 protein n=1 Tax=Francisella sp. 19X1-34 TaxID=3087177 RepID=UPI002E333E71|nr:glycosyltransferase family 2 protein [Francisella sp. 19X1-34]MED7788015.1 glycosyltransferase family 2 protein [Francisella sp. 19X1-34]
MLKILSIVISYNPNIKGLNNLLESLLNINTTKIEHEILVVDNNSLNIVDIKNICLKKNIRLNKLKHNMGIAYAQNIGIKCAIKEKYNYILLSDQDSLFPQNYFSKMIKYFNNDVAAIGPAFININSGEKSGYIKSIRMKSFKQPKNEIHQVRHIIASGKIINVSSISKVGLMDEELFIDYVDLEWCWRAEKNDLKVLFNANISIKHFLGDGSAKILKKEYQVRSHIRYYYLIRNGIYLAIYNKEKTLSVRERFIIFCKSFIYITVYSLHYPRAKNSSACFSGLADGFRKRLGKKT